jgi:hypothetical protein
MTFRPEVIIAITSAHGSEGARSISWGNLSWDAGQSRSKATMPLAWMTEPEGIWRGCFKGAKEEGSRHPPTNASWKYDNLIN